MQYARVRLGFVSYKFWHACALDVMLPNLGFPFFTRFIYHLPTRTPQVTISQVQIAAQAHLIATV